MVVAKAGALAARDEARAADRISGSYPTLATIRAAQLPEALLIVDADQESIELVRKWAANVGFSRTVIASGLRDASSILSMFRVIGAVVECHLGGQCQSAVMGAISRLDIPMVVYSAEADRFAGCGVCSGVETLGKRRDDAKLRDWLVKLAAKHRRETNEAACS